MQRDPQDRRYRERLAGSYLASLLLHTLLALLVFTVAINTAQEGANENVQGGSLITLEQQRAPVLAQAPSQPERAAPVPRAPVQPVVRHAPAAQPAHQPLPPRPHELSKFAPTAPPNPTPLPQASVQPNVQPTTAVFEPVPQRQLPAVPTSVPTASAVAVTVTMPPTAAPKPPAPTAAPTEKAQTPAPAAAATAAPSSKPAAPRSSQPPAPKPGVASPSPTTAPALAATADTAPSPGPKGNAKPGPSAGSGATHSAPSRPVTVQSPATPRPHPPATPKKTSAAPDINARLRALLPHNAVVPNEGGFHPPVTVGNTEPTPPPEILALTKFIFEERGAGNDAKLKMWVTGTHRVGPALYCDGWLLRYPHSGQPPQRSGTMANPVAGGISIGVGSSPGGYGRPIVESHASTLCSQRDLQPFAPSSGASP